MSDFEFDFYIGKVKLPGWPTAAIVMSAIFSTAAYYSVVAITETFKPPTPIVHANNKPAPAPSN